MLLSRALMNYSTLVPFSPDISLPPPTAQVSIGGTLLEFLPTLLFIGWAYWLVSRQMRNMPGGFGGPGEDTG